MILCYTMMETTNHVLVTHLPGHYKTRGFVAHFIDHTSISSSKFTDMLEIIIFQLAQIGFLREKSFQTLLLLLVQVELFQLLLQGLKIRSEV